MLAELLGWSSGLLLLLLLDLLLRLLRVALRCWRSGESRVRQSLLLLLRRRLNGRRWRLLLLLLGRGVLLLLVDLTRLDTGRRLRRARRLGDGRRRSGVSGLLLLRLRGVRLRRSEGGLLSLWWLVRLLLLLDGRDVGLLVGSVRRLLLLCRRRLRWRLLDMSLLLLLVGRTLSR